jgi:hypothetical protein
MSQGFEIKFASAKKSFPSHPQLQEVAEIQTLQQSLVQHFAALKDPRVERTKKHLLTDILTVAILAIIAGAQGWKTSRIMALVKKSG